MNTRAPYRRAQRESNAEVVESRAKPGVTADKRSDVQIKSEPGWLADDFKGRAMDPISVIAGPVSHLDRSDVDTDQIMPKQ
ncbi:MAG TPA: hypothetical protein VH025_09200, partial [Solirubrobacteraceae bacterium]|nr:hypothetical protein [Solirubrobacteraceae bacterium]